MNEYKKSGLTLKKIREELSKEYGEEKISFELKKSQISTYQDRFVKLIDRIIENKTVLKYYIEDKSKKLLKS